MTLLGDSGYKLEPWCMCIIPILDAAPGSNEDLFTKDHCKARNSVERCIGVLKGRFRCLLKDRVLYHAPRKAGLLVKACCVLHNMCSNARLPEDPDAAPVEGEKDDVLPPEDEQSEDEMDARLAIDPNERNVDRVAAEVRNRLVELLAIQRHELNQQ
ncbi:Putative nuclease [Frankliniella fusca]|uniref:Nuclease n=1 Tax=Frankliniella fusca TaxID=407009 RepID=A0AAE1HZL2_9NEOP|nr:Putative nuclease [Frankliniella fusca]